MTSDLIKGFIEDMYLWKQQGNYVKERFIQFKEIIDSIFLRLGIDVTWIIGNETCRVFIFATDRDRKWKVYPYRYSLESILSEVYGDLDFNEYIVALVYFTDDERVLIKDFLLRYEEA